MMPLSCTCGQCSREGVSERITALGNITVFVPKVLCILSVIVTTWLFGTLCIYVCGVCWLSWRVHSVNFSLGICEPYTVPMQFIAGITFKSTLYYSTLTHACMC